MIILCGRDRSVSGFEDSERDVQQGGVQTRQALLKGVRVGASLKWGRH